MSSPPPPAGAAREAAHLPERIGHFGIHGVLGRGGMGVVFDAQHPSGERVALKVIQAPNDGGRSSTLVARFLREARILGQLGHPGVVRLVDAGDIDGTLYLAMDRIEGVSLLSIRRQGPLEFDPVVQLGVHISAALAHMHDAGVVHRDIKPANILIKADGQPVITDFGISGMSEATGITRQGDLLGSPGFMAPEVIGGQPPTARSDLYALGRLLFELGARGASRRLPRKAPIFEVLRIAQQIDWPRFPGEGPWPRLRAVLERMLAPAPGERFEDARAAQAAFETLGSTVLDTDTLSEHVDQLALPPRTSYEALAHDLVTHPPAAEAEDDMLRDFELPAGMRSASDDPTKPPWEGSESALPPAPGGADDFLTSSDAVSPADRTRVDRPRDTLPPAGLPQVGVPAGTVAMRPTGAPSPDGLDETVPLDLVLPTGAAEHADAAMPLDELVSNQPQAPTPSPEAAEIDRLERQLARAREDIAQLRRSLAEAQKPTRRIPWILAVIAAAVLGAALGGSLPRPEPIVPSVVVTPANPNAPTTAAFKYGKTAPPSAQDRDDAAGLLAQAQTHLSNRDLDAAERLLGLCIEVADLPDCHRTLGTLFGFTRNPAARAHFERYLELAPHSPEAPGIRAALAR